MSEGSGNLLPSLRIAEDAFDPFFQPSLALALSVCLLSPFGRRR